MPPLSESLRTRDRDEVLEFAYRRGTLLRRRRVVVRSAAVAAGVMALAMPLALIMRDNADPQSQRVNFVDQPPTTEAPVDPTQNEIGALGPAPAGGTAPSSQGAAPARSVGAAPAAGKAKPTTTMALQEVVRACAANEVELTTTTDKSAYLPTDAVRVTTRIRNTSNRRCLSPSTAGLTIVGPDGRVAFSDTASAASTRFEPGAVVELSFTWDPDVPMQGRHTVQAVWRAGRDFGPSETSFSFGVA